MTAEFLIMVYQFGLYGVFTICTFVFVLFTLVVINQIKRILG